MSVAYSEIVYMWYLSYMFITEGMNRYASCNIARNTNVKYTESYLSQTFLTCANITFWFCQYNCKINVYHGNTKQSDSFIMSKIIEKMYKFQAWNMWIKKKEFARQKLRTIIDFASKTVIYLV